ncbi:hypothetical protein PsYK624_012440 [Phanerochaete sordida]|uniref:Pentacotripeptide-repeat region of PRORP domain-containing protein n=1 Tax=Phanerochaete sordida TaxID=48140 RepID=A0A9P3L7K5_9APHY|nr:hypothetical protein PsYK624_012440 [Phanerochaete sordida]
MDPELWAVYISGLIRTRRGETSAHNIWAGITTLLHPIPTCVWVAAITAFTSIGRYDRAEATWNMLQGVVRWPGPEAYSAYIASLFGENRTKDALHLFDKFKGRVGKEPYPAEDPSVLSVFHTVLDRLLRVDLTQPARAIFDRMATHGPRPTVETYNIFMRYFAKQRDLKSISATFAELSASGIAVDTSTAAVLLAALYPAREDAVALVFALLKQHHIVLDLDNSLTLLKHLTELARDDAFEAAIGVLEHLERDLQFTPPTELAYLVVLCAIERCAALHPARTRVLRAKMLRKMRASGRNPSRSATATMDLVKACLANPRKEAVQSAVLYYQKFSEYRQTFSPELVIIILHDLRRRGEWDIADTILKDLGDMQERYANYPALSREIGFVKNRVSRQSELDAEEDTLDLD